MAKHRLESLERKFKKNPGLAELHDNQTEEYIALDHAHQLSKEEAKSNSEITNYIPYIGVT